MPKLQLKDLITSLDEQQPSVNKTTQEFIQRPSERLSSLPIRKQKQIKREGTYRTTQQEMDKWVGIVKLNREKETLNLVKKDKDNGNSVSFFPATPISDFHQKIENQLKVMDLSGQQNVMRKEEEALGKLSKEEAQQRLREARRQRTAQFNEEIKRRRIAKIKSKLYHKIKKRQKVREEAKRVSELQGQEKREYMEKMTKNRIHERITLRHRTKNQHIQNLLRFSKHNQQSIQDSLKQVNAIRQQQLQKNQQLIGNLSEELDEQNYRQNLEDLQNEVDQMEQEPAPKKGLESMKFMQIGKQKQLDQHKQQLKDLSRMMVGEDVMEVEDSPEEEQVEITRKTFGQSKSKDKNQQKGKSNFIQRNLKHAIGSEGSLTEGINVNRLKEKYQPQRSELKLTTAIQESLGQNNIIEENYRQFQKQKEDDFEADLPQQPKKLKGWGSWAGPGISEPKIDHAAEVKKKLAKIEAIKRKRRDGQISGVIVRQSYNKDLKDYFVNKLPHNMKSSEQFDYLQNEPLGPQWNTLTQFKTNIKGKILTQVGSVIQPVKMPKHLSKNPK